MGPLGEEKTEENRPTASYWHTITSNFHPHIVNMRLVSYNIRGGLGMDGRRSIERIAEVLRGIEADVICLQEVHRRLPLSRFQNQPNRLARLLGKRACFHNLWRGAIGGYGNALLTALPVRAVSALFLPNDEEHRRRPPLRIERRGLLEVVVQTPGGPLAVLGTHWSLEAADRERSAEEIARRIADLPTPVILAGDFNASAESAEIQKLRDLTGLVDAGWSEAQPTFPSDHPAARIDYIWHSPGLEVSRVEVVDTQASDHRPVVVDLTK